MSHFRSVHVADLSWEPLGTHGLRRKPLANDPETGAMMSYLDIPKDWRGGGIAHFHEAFEEVYMLEGSVTLGAGRWFVAGDYFYRPAHVVHGHDEQAREGAIALVRSDGPLALNLVREPAEPDEYPLEQGDPRGHVLQLPVEEVAWQTLDGFPAAWAMRLLSRDPESGALTAMARIPPGWSSTAPIAHRARWSAYLLDGEITIDGATLTKDTFAEGAAGTGPTGPAASIAGATLLLWFDALDG